MVIQSAKLKTKGINASAYSEEKLRELVAFINEEATELESELVKDTPANFGRLKGGWVLTPATLKQKRPKAIINQSVSYFLPVELGRSPGKGISKNGQKDVARWAKLVLGLKESKTKSSSVTPKTFAFLLSQKYKKEGRPALGFVGLAKPGEIPSSTPNIPDEPVQGSLLYGAFDRIKANLRRV